LAGNPRCGLVTLATEHRAVLDPLAALARRGAPLTVLPVEPDGLVDLERLGASLGPDTLLLSVMAANNEIGVLQPLEAIGALCRRHGVLFHCDAAQAVGHIPLSMGELGIDLLTLSAHKFYGPKGVGALLIRPGVAIAPQQLGGGQERGLRAGTLAVPLIMGLAAALGLAADIYMGQFDDSKYREFAAQHHDGKAAATYFTTPSGFVSFRMSMCSASQPSSRAITEAIRSA
jgi:cysteine desulfurase